MTNKTNIKLIEGPERRRYARNGAMVKSYNTTRHDINDGYTVFEWGTGDKMVLKGSDHNRIYDSMGIDNLSIFEVDGIEIVSEFSIEEFKSLTEY